METERGAPKVYASPRRSFYCDCGTLLSYEDERLPGKIYLYVGALDDPEPFEPEMHDWVS